jgi:hypothetical protein
MGTVNRIIQSEDDRTMAARLVENRTYPFTLTITDGKPRTKAQNRLQHKWMQEIAEQKGDLTAEEARAYCKLTIGVPILRSQNAAFKERYDAILKPLTYEQKLSIMSEPLNLPVTSLMSTKQLTEYLDGIIRHFGEQGIILTMPDDLKDQIKSNSDDATPSDNAGDQTPVLSPDAAEEVPPASSAATITDCAKEMLALAVISYPNDKERDEAMHQCLDQWEKRLPEKQAQIDSISVAATAVANGKRTAAQAHSFLSETLQCTVEELQA